MLDKSLGLYIDRSTQQGAADMPTMHAHKSHEIYYLISGQRRYLIGHTIYDVTPGDLVLIPRSRLHRTVSPGPTGYERYVCNFLEDRIQPFIQSMGREVFDRLIECGCLRLPSHVAHSVHRDLERMEQELTERREGCQAVALHLLEGILISALRYGTPKDPIHGEGADKVQALARYIALNYAQPITLRSAATMACLEDTYFSRRFKALTGFGFQEYLTQTRLQAAERLLHESQLSVAEIAEQCGFSGANYFGDVFRRWKGCSPSQYRSKNK